MDKLIRLPKANRAEEPLLDIEERRNNYDDRRSYTSYDEITKDFENDFRSQDDIVDDISYSSPAHCSDKKDAILITQDDVSCSSSSNLIRQRKLPILTSLASGSITDATVVGSPCASGLLLARSAIESPALCTRDTPEVDNAKVKSNMTLQESIRESLSINNHHNLGGYSANHQIFEMNEFYINMLTQLNEMRKDFGSKKVIQQERISDTDTEDQTELDEWIVNDSCKIDEVVHPKIRTCVENCKYDAEVMKEFDKIVRLDREIEIVDLEWKRIRKQRLETRKYLCELTVENNQVDFEKSQTFLGLSLPSEVDVEEKPVAENTDVNFNKGKPKCRSAGNLSKNFVKRNVDLAKNMSFPVSLTDEEKIKLDSILQEDEEEVDEENIKADEEIDTESDHEDDQNQSIIITKNEYKFLDDDFGRMSEINEQIKNLAMVEENILDINDVECQLDDDVKLGKNWKYSLLDERLKDIDLQLSKITQDRIKENENTSEIEKIRTSPSFLEVA